VVVRSPSLSCSDYSRPVLSRDEDIEGKKDAAAASAPVVVETQRWGFYSPSWKEEVDVNDARMTEVAISHRPPLVSSVRR
jgi:hypothetical protein